MPRSAVRLGGGEGGREGGREGGVGLCFDAEKG